MNLKFLLLVAAFTVCACQPSGPPPAPSVDGAWIRAAPPGARMTAGYLTIENPTGEALRIVGARSDAFDEIELHATISEGGVARMRQESGVTVPAGGAVAFSPGGRHLMLFGPTRPLAEGDTVDLVIELADGAELSATARVSRDGSTVHEH